MAENEKCWRLLRRRELWVPTWRCWLVLAVVLGLTGFVLGRGMHSFLAVNDPVTGGSLVVEGWCSDYILQEVASEFQRDHYQKVYVTGGPLEFGALLSEYKTYAQRGAAVLLKLGLSTNVVQAVPAPEVRQDRTYAEAAVLRNWFRDHGASVTKLHLITGGPHARRSRLMFEKALGKGVRVGVTAVPIKDYDPEHWWRSSAGVRGVIGEALAYGYARVLFRAPKTPIAATNADK